jgi:hypothetical protein
MVVKSELSRSKRQSGREPAGNVPASDSSGEATDNAMMLRCIELSRIAVGKGEYPFGTVMRQRGRCRRHHRLRAQGVRRRANDDCARRHYRRHP